MSKPSVASYLRKMNNQAVIMRVSGIPTVEDTDEIRDNLKQLLQNNDIDTDRLKEDDVKFYVEGGTNFWMKPKLRKMRTGILKVRSKDYIFIPDGEPESRGLYGDKKGLTCCPDNIKVEKVINPDPRVGGLISYELA